MAELTERFPPLMTPARLAGGVEAFAHALAHAGRDGAGTLYHMDRQDRIEFALVLEPEEALAAARRVLFCAMNALAETIAADAPPEREVLFTYPSAVIFDDGLVGGMRLGWPVECRERDVPEWLVLGATIHNRQGVDGDFNLDPTLTTLEEAGMRDVDPEGFAARFCRHLLVEIDEWQHVGFAGVGERYLQRIARGETDGIRRIEPNGDLVIHDQTTGGRRVLPLLDGLRA